MLPGNDLNCSSPLMDRTGFTPNTSNEVNKFLNAIVPLVKNYMVLGVIFGYRSVCALLRYCECLHI